MQGAARTVRLDVVHDAVAIDVGVQPGRRKMQLADRAPCSSNVQRVTTRLRILQQKACLVATTCHDRVTVPFLTAVFMMNPLKW